MSKIIIYGGAFNPPTISHIETAKVVLKKSGYDELWFMPCYNHAFKMNLLSAKHRAEMLNLVIKGQTHNMKVCDWEINNKGKYTIDTVEQIKEKYPEHTFAWLIGADNATTFNTWKDYEKLLNEITIIIVDRFNNDRESFNWLLNGENIYITTPNIPPFTSDISSTKVRKLAKNHLKNADKWSLSIKSFLTNEVLLYIEENGLYLNKKKK